ncbi:hypothetical protein SeMB42_g00369 [Synchytrium endobioticum]|uniref:NDT80 domain-containing protein n=1 Tax=Synchytrium endobioticum TaxID=286115 RepID=A0A507DTK5_9FUNG|nr:hypothetical protein SeLEV6574_g01290 [Synchytrium endobioticum]TPX54278.1 hypothetical protein SeMB42_g00369 [Synchytrium endobioticum]
MAPSYTNTKMTTNALTQLPLISQQHGHPLGQAVVCRELDGSDVKDEKVQLDTQVKEQQDHIAHHHGNGQSYSPPDDPYQLKKLNFYNEYYLESRNPRVPTTNCTPAHTILPKSPNAMVPRDYSMSRTPLTPSSSTEELNSQPAPDGTPNTPKVRTSSPNATRSSLRRAASSDGGPFFKPTRQMRMLQTMERDEAFSVKIQAWIDKGFFMADGDWTCYRHLPCLVYDERNPQGTVLMITSFHIGVIARAAQSAREVELVQHTAKRDKGPQSAPVPTSCPVTKAGASASVVGFERLQFKQATANNGRRRATQQYHVLVVQLHGSTANGVDLIVAESESANLVVRGRAPGHYQAQDSRATSESPNKDEDVDGNSGELMDHSNSGSFQSAFSAHDPSPSPAHHERTVNDVMAQPDSNSYSAVGSVPPRRQPPPPAPNYSPAAFHQYSQEIYADSAEYPKHSRGDDSVPRGQKCTGRKRRRWELI